MKKAPIFRAETIESNDIVVGYYIGQDIDCDNVNTIQELDNYYNHDIKVETLQISFDHEKWYDIDEAENNRIDKSCIDCKWCKLGGEFENDECHNTSLSAHLDQGNMVSQDFSCNRWEKRDD